MHEDRVLMGRSVLENTVGRFNAYLVHEDGEAERMLDVKHSIRRSLDHSNVGKLTFGYDFGNEACKRKRLGKWFTDDDVESTRALKRKMDDDQDTAREERCERRASENARWAALKDKWDKSETGGYLNKRHYEFDAFGDVP
eukprot:5366388-Prymnesium_polylepis.1